MSTTDFQLPAEPDNHKDDQHCSIDLIDGIGSSEGDVKEKNIGHHVFGLLPTVPMRISLPATMFLSKYCSPVIGDSTRAKIDLATLLRQNCRLSIGGSDLGQKWQKRCS
jgi:hypothetical protein